MTPPGTVLTVGDRHYSLEELRALATAVDDKTWEESTRGKGEMGSFGPFEMQSQVEYLYGDGTRDVVGVLVAG